VILVDANLLIYAKFTDMPQYFGAKRWLEEQLNSGSKVGIPWHSLLAFLRLSTNPRLFGRPLPIRTAWQEVLDWVNHPRTWIPEPTDDHAEVLGKILTGMQITAKLIPDAHLAAIAIEHGLTVCSADADFARFPGVSWTNPLNK
jgi:uncharacterized protein